MGEAISALYNELSGLLNASAFSVDSIEGLIIMLLFLCCIYSLWHKAVFEIPGFIGFGKYFFSE